MRSLVLSLILLSSCQSEGIHSNKNEIEDGQIYDASSYYCGAEEVKSKDVRGYFELAKRVIIDGDYETSEMRSLFSRNLTIRKNGELISYRPDELNDAELLSLIPASEWEKMIEINEEGLQPVGYRGCIMAAGKVLFNTQFETGEFGLANFDFDRSW